MLLHTQRVRGIDKFTIRKKIRNKGGSGDMMVVYICDGEMQIGEKNFKKQHKIKKNKKKKVFICENFNLVEVLKFNYK